MTTAIERIIQAQDYLNIAMSLMHSKDIRDSNNIWQEEEKETINKNIATNLKNARGYIELAITEVAEW